MIERIYGIDYQIPDIPQKSKIANFHLDKKKQKFYRTEEPGCFDELEYDAEENPLYEAEHLKFITQEINRIFGDEEAGIKSGYWFYNFGKAVWITGLHYLFLNYFYLENGYKPDYRDTDRRWFYFQDYCEKQPHIFGIVRIKKRREGATSQAVCSLLKTALSRRKARCGIISKTGKPDAFKVFDEMLMPAFRALPIWLKPQCEDEETKSVLRLIKKKSTKKLKGLKKGQVYSNNRGLESSVDWRNTTTTSYDSGRVTEILIDEAGKWEEIAVSTYWPIVKKTLGVGAIKVGFALMPSTVNQAKKGGENFKKIWDGANQFESTVTSNGLYRYFCPADEGYEGFIDEYGYSIKEKPTPSERKYVKEKFGLDIDCTPREWILNRRKTFKDAELLAEEIRMEPLTEKEAFSMDRLFHLFDMDKLDEQEEYLSDHPPKLRTIRFFRREDGKVDWVDDPNGFWKILYFPEEHEINRTYQYNNKTHPGNAHKYTVSADPFRNSQVSGKGSMGGGYVMKKLDNLDPENSGMPIAQYLGRPKMKDYFHEDMLMAAEYYGADICYENDIADYQDYLIKKQKLTYAKERPSCTIDPSRKVKARVKEYGTPSRDEYSYAMQINLCISYILLYCHKIYFLDLIKDLKTFDIEERTKHDLAVAFQVGLTAIAAPVKIKNEVKRSAPVVKTYRLRA